MTAKAEGRVVFWSGQWQCPQGLIYPVTRTLAGSLEASCNQRQAKTKWPHTQDSWYFRGASIVKDTLHSSVKIEYVCFSNSVIKMIPQNIYCINYFSV